jgi:hypothetical protein
MDGEIYDLVYLVTADARHDIAVLKVPIDRAHTLPLSFDDSVSIGAPVYVLGNPLGQIGTFSNGLVSAQRAYDGLSLVQITAPVSPGSSGGPVMNDRGEVIGVTTLMLPGGQNINYAVPARYVRPLAASTDEPHRFSRELLRVAEDDRSDTPSRTRPARDGEPSTPDASATDILSSQVLAFDSVIVGNGGNVAGEAGGKLYQGSVARHSATLDDNGKYIIVGVCDTNCGRLELSLASPDGAPVARSKGDTDKPWLGIADVNGGRYRLEVTMRQCDAPRCAYAVRLYSMGPGVR